MSYEKDFFGFPYDIVKNAPDLLPHDLCCDGCAEHCKLSAKFNVYDAFLNPGFKKVTLIDVVMYAGDVKLNFPVPVPDNVTKAHKVALAWCRATCKHSKLR
jgi:hypothetical protein